MIAAGRPRSLSSPRRSIWLRRWFDRVRPEAAPISSVVAEARRRLRSTDEIVEVIAERVGYADATHFIRLFRRAHGVTPAAWRTGHHGAASPVLPIKHPSTLR